MTFDRREFCKFSLLGAGAMALHPRLAFGSGSSQRDVLVCIFQRGGMDGLNAVVPYADSDYRRLRPTIGLAEPGGGAGSTLDLDGFFGLNPAAIALAPLYDAGELAFVHAAGGLHGDFSHFTAQALMERGVLQHVPEYSGWLNRHLEIVGPSVAFQAVGMGTAVAPSLRGDAPVIGVGSLADVALTTRSPRAAATPDLLKLLYLGSDDVDCAAQQAFDAIAILDQADPAQYPVEQGATYPDTAFGRQMSEIAQLIKAGIGLEVACVDIGGWDHHNGLNDELTPLLQQFAETLAAFRTDLGARMAGVSVVAMTEFGRRAYENGSAGTDHGVGGVLIALGGGVVGGRVYADWPGLRDADLLDGNLSITTDYRTVLAEWLRKRAGNGETAGVFPEFSDPGELGLFRAR